MAQKMSSATAEKYQPISAVCADSNKMREIREFLQLLRPIDLERTKANSVVTASEETWKLFKNNIALRLGIQPDSEASFRDTESGYVVKVKRTRKQGSLNHDALIMLAQAFLAQFMIDDATVADAFNAVNIKLAYKSIANGLGITDEQFETMWESAYTPSTDEYYDVRLYDFGAYSKTELDKDAELEKKLAASIQALNPAMTPEIVKATVADAQSASTEDLEAAAQIYDAHVPAPVRPKAQPPRRRLGV